MNSSKLPERILKALQEVTGPGDVGLHEPELTGNEKKYLLECIDSGFVSSVGSFVDRFEDDIVRYTDSRFAIAVVNGTAALHVSLLLCGVRQQDEVLLPALTFVATANAVAYCGAVPHFVESEEQTLGVDPIKLRSHLESQCVRKNGQCVNSHTGRIVRACIIMHTFGHPSKIRELQAICEEFGISLIEDAAESLGSFYESQHTGITGTFGTLSFNGNKTITTGGGGMILTQDPELARKAKHLTTTARIPSGFAHEHDMVGYNYRMPNINAALGCAQLERLNEFVSEQRSLYQKYTDALASLPEVRVFAEPRDCRSNYWLQTLLLPPDKNGSDVVREEVLRVTNEAGVMTRPCWKLMHQLTMFSDAPRMDLPVAEMLQRRIINIPSSPVLARNR